MAIVNDYSPGDLMAAIRSLQEVTSLGFANVDARLGEQDAKFDRRIDGLRHDMNRRFDAVDRRFDGMDQRFDAMDQRFDAMDQRFDRIDGRLERLEQAKTA